MAGLRLIWTLAQKDLRIEWRSRQSLLTTVFFALLILVIFNFSFDPGSPAIQASAPGILWVSLLFPSVIQLNRSFQLEREEGTLHGILLSPLDRGLFFLGKLLANWLFLLLIDILVLVAFVIFFNLSLSVGLLWIGLLMVLASLGYTAVGTLFAAMVSSLRTREVLLPILLFPIVIPVIIAAVNATGELLNPGEVEFLRVWIQLLVAFDVIFLAACFVVFEYVVGE